MVTRYQERILNIRTDSSKTSPIVWIGLVGVFDQSPNKILEGAPGAYVNVLALAQDSEGYQAQVREALSSAGFKVFEIEETEPFSDRMAKFKMDPALRALAAEVAQTGVPSCGEFYVFENSEQALSDERPPR